MTHYDNCLYDYQNGNYRVVILENGTKIRETEEDEFIPAFAENSDVKITDKCDGGCPFCYEGCTENGKHAQLFGKNGKPLLEQRWLSSLHAGTEIALNGNDLTHPDLNPENPRLLKYLKERGVITNLTVNQKHFMKYHKILKKWCDEKLIWGLGISLSNSGDPKFYKALGVRKFPNVVIHVVAGLFDAKDVIAMSGRGLKLLILGYKKLGRGEDYLDKNAETIYHKMLWLAKNLKFITANFKVTAFDNLALEQLCVKRTLFDDNEKRWNEFYMGRDGSSTYYIDAVEMQYAKNSCMPASERFSSKGLTVDQMFNDIRKKYAETDVDRG